MSASTAKGLDFVRSLPISQQGVAKEIFFICEMYELWIFLLLCVYPFIFVLIAGFVLRGFSYPINLVTVLICEIVGMWCLTDLIRKLMRYHRFFLGKKVLEVIANNDSNLLALRALADQYSHINKIARENNIL